jgi:hypothetical protein
VVLVPQSFCTAQSPTERNHKMQGAIKTKVSNRLKSETTNKRLNAKTTEVLYAELHMAWLEASRPNPTPKLRSR